MVLRIAARCRQHQGSAAPQRQPRQSQARHRKQNDGHPDHPLQGPGACGVQRRTGNPAHPGPALGGLAEEGPQRPALRIWQIQPALRSSLPCALTCALLCALPRTAHAGRSLRQAGRQPLAEIGGQGRQVGCRAGPGRQGAACAVHQKAGPAGVQQGPQGRQHLVDAGRARLLVQQTGHGHAADARGLLLRRMLGLVGAQQQPGRGRQHKDQQGQQQQDQPQAYGHGIFGQGITRRLPWNGILGPRGRDRVEAGGLVHGKVCRKPCAQTAISAVDAMTGPAVPEPISRSGGKTLGPVPPAQGDHSRFRAQSVSRRFAATSESSVFRTRPTAASASATSTSINLTVIPARAKA